MAKGILITADNKISIKDFEAPLYKSIGTAVGGYIEIVNNAAFPYPIKDAIMIVNDEALLKNLRLNIAGSCIYGTHIHGNPILGDIVIMKIGYTDDGPDIVGIPDEEIGIFYKALTNTFRHLKEIEK